ncbi:MAG: DUF4292 domain-containing protein [Bacteroidetes bacterium]|nr:DUF4292 domain-containing protein [Bacteroidota bacterium]
MPNKLQGSILMLLVFTLSSCGLFRNSSSLPDTFKNIRQLKRGLNELQLNYNWFSAKVKMKLNTGGNNLKTSGELKMKKDSLVWGKATKFIELARFQMQQDEFSVINRLESKYAKLNPKDFLGDVPLDFSAVTTVQKLLLGEFPFVLNDNDQVEFINQVISITRTHKTGKLTALLDASTLKMKEVVVYDGQEQKLALGYNQYQEVESSLVPAILNVHLFAGGSQEVGLELLNIRLSNQEKVEFSIPDDYEQMQF